MRLLLFFLGIQSLSYSKSILPINCPAGYNDDGSGNCYAPIIAQMDRKSAYKQCSEKYGFMFLIKNKQENMKIQKMAGPSTEHDKISLGITCLSNTVDSCQWDTGDDVNYSNFYKEQNVTGKLDVNEGACVYMLVSTGKWFSAPCSNTKLWTGCQYSEDKTEFVPACADSANSNAKAYLFRNKCYYAISDVNFNSALRNCQSSCGNLTSIHSLGENNYIRDLVTSGTDNSFVITGLQLNADQKSYRWEDGTAVDFVNFKQQIPAAGWCVLMEIDDGEQADRGFWSNSPCTFSDSQVAVCQKEIANQCDKTQPTLAPPDCLSSQNLQETGTVTIHLETDFKKTLCYKIYSSGWPMNSGNNLCKYYITEDPATKAVFNFLALDIPASSVISLYNGQADKYPFANITNTKQLGYYYSTTNVMKIVFNSTGGGSANNNFRIEYGGAPTSCSGTTLTGSGTFTTPHYPENYPTDTDLTWCLVSVVKRVQLVFTDFFTESSADYVIVYDGQGPILDTLSGALSPNFNVTSMCNTMRVVFHSDKEVTARGFSATFTSVN